MELVAYVQRVFGGSPVISGLTLFLIATLIYLKIRQKAEPLQLYYHNQSAIIKKVL
jgi:hypothetical protein